MMKRFAAWGLVALMGCETAMAIEIRAAHFPPLPEGWSVSLINNLTVVYRSPLARNSSAPSSVLRFTHTRKTEGKDAQGYMDDYVRRNSCDRPEQQAIGGYLTSCHATETVAMVVGEPNNLYLLELSGVYSKTAVDTFNTYLNEIVRGKHTFEDRDIGEKVVKRRPLRVPVPAAAADKDKDKDNDKDKDKDKGKEDKDKDEKK